MLNSWRLNGRTGLCLALLTVLAGGAHVYANDCGCGICDFDNDGDVDQSDYGHLQTCYSDPLGGLSTECRDADLNGDEQIGQADFEAFRACMGGAGVPVERGVLDSPLITEFMASNADGLADEDGEHPDWIEIYNPCRPWVSLAGWHLSDDPAELTKWKFPAVGLRRGEFLVVFASNKDRAEPNQPLHTNFRLGAEGGPLFLVAPDGQTIVHSFTPKYPPQLMDISYGLSQSGIHLIKSRASARYRVPTQSDANAGTGWTAPDYPDGSWVSGQTGLGFSSIPPTFDVKFIKAKDGVYICDLSTAEMLVTTPSMQASTSSEQSAIINYFNTGGIGNFANDRPFPGTQINVDVEHYVMLATGTIVVPSVGEWTFGVNSDDGFILTLTRGAQKFETSFPAPRGPGDTLAVFNITEPGTYDVRLLMYECGGGSEVEFFAAPGYYSGFDPGVFRLVGDVANGGLPVGVLGGDVATDIGSSMRGKNASVWVRVPFTLDDPSAYNLLSLRMKYEDGFVAYLNGQEVARRNAPAELGWNAAASADRSLQSAQLFEEISLTGFLGHLRAGKNVLAIQGLNDAAADGDFLVLPELVAGASGLQTQYFASATPGSLNVSGSVDFVRDLKFNVPHGFFTSAFALEITSETPDVQIRYTLNGSEPTETTGLVYGGPIPIDKTTTIRARGFRPNFLSSRLLTSTYLFLGDVVRQSPNGEAPGPGWPTGSPNGQRMDYGMDPDVVNDPRYADLMDDALLSIPSISIVTELGNLFDPGRGIYVNPGGQGRAWERPASVELIHPDGTPGFQIDAGLRIRGGFSRSGGNPKHAFRLFFRNEYGEGKLHYPLFGDEGVNEFDNMDLRTAQNYSWSFGGDPNNIMNRDVWSRDTQGIMGQPYTRSRYYHLYLNGHYWGLYQTEERPEASFAASYFGGKNDDYDVIKAEAGPYVTVATDGNLNAASRMWEAVRNGVTDEIYYRLQGLNPDGTRNYSYEVLLDVENLIVEMLGTYYTGDLDGPISNFLGNQAVNNFYGIRHHNGQSGFKWIRHDCEHTLLNVWENRTGPWPAGDTFDRFNAQWLHQQLIAGSAEYRMQFSDRAYQALFGNGPLTARAGVERFMARANQINLAIIGESARWGDAQRNSWDPPLNRNDHWLPAINNTVNNFFPQRGNVLIQQLREKGWYPNTPAPVLSHPGGSVPSGLEVVLSHSTGGGGTIYYTVDGTDPRLPGGGIAPGARIYEAGVSTVTMVQRGSTWWYKDDGSNQGTAWRGRDFDPTGWRSGQAELGYGDGGEKTPVRCSTADVCDPNYGQKYATTYFRRTFELPADMAISGLLLKVVRDDSAAVYINGSAPIPFNMPGTWDYSTYTNANCVGGGDESAFFEQEVDMNNVTLYAGTNSVAVEVHQCSGTSSDLSFDLELTGTQTTTLSDPIIINENTRLKVRALNGADWSPLVEATYLVGPVPLYINEVMATNAAFLADPAEPDEFPDWFEIYNPNSIDVDLGGMYLTDNPDKSPTKWQIPGGTMIRRGERLLFYADDDGTQGKTHVGFKLDGTDGEAVALFDRDGITAIDLVRFGPQTTDVSIGRHPDGTGEWGTMSAPTPGQPNAGP